MVEGGDVCRDPCAVQPRDPEGPAERFAAYGEVVTLGRGMQVRPSAGCGGSRIGYDGRLAVRIRADGHPHQLALGGSLAAPDTGPDRFASHQGSTLPPRRLVPEPGARP